MSQITEAIYTKGGVAEGAGAIPDNGVEVRITGYEGNVYRAHYSSGHAALLRVAAPYFPGGRRKWTVAPWELCRWTLR